MTLTDDAIDRIVKAVGREPIGQPDEKDTFVGDRGSSTCSRITLTRRPPM
jgi:hypothetical protein